MRADAGVTLLSTALAVGWPAVARADHKVLLGGAHVGYAAGGGLSAVEGGFRQGLDVAFMPLLLRTEHSGQRDAYATDQGRLLGGSAFVGFGESPKYLALDVGYGVSTIVGAMAALGPTVRFEQDGLPQAWGGEAR